MPEPTLSAAVTPAPLAATILKAVWLSILLGVLIQVLIVLATTYNKDTIVQETVGKVTWSVLVCTAIAVGNTLAKMRPAVVGVIGFLAAPAAFVAAKAVQKSITQGNTTGPPVPSPVEISVVRALEYAVLGGVLAWMGQKAARASVRNFALVGLAVGFGFGGYLLYRFITRNEPTPKTPMIAARTINEVLFPIGCALVLWTAGHLGTALGHQPSHAVGARGA